MNQDSYYKTIEDLQNQAGIVPEFVRPIQDVVTKLLMKPASLDKHHSYKNGLIIHTVQVIELALMNAEYWIAKGVKINKSNLFFAALYHDLGKIYEYRLAADGTNIRNDFYNKIYHVPFSATLWYEDAKKMNYPEQDIMEVYHAIISHHALPEWGSYRPPQTQIAWLLHLSDSMSARLDERM